MKQTLTYEQPSCTLDVAAHVLPLGNRLTRQPVRSLRFKLIVRPEHSQPEHPEHSKTPGMANGSAQAHAPTYPIELTGNDQDLYQLATVVEEYVQTLLIRPPSSPKPPESLPVEQNPGELEFQDEFELASQDEDEDNLLLPLLPLDLPPPEKVIYLESETPLNHRLYLGPLATPDSGDRLKLRLTELFDLATVLEEWSAKMQPLPELLATSRSQLERLPIWFRSAAVALVVLGISAALIQLVERPVLISQDAPTAEAPNTMEPGIDNPLVLPPLGLEQPPLPPLEGDFSLVPLPPGSLPEGQEVLPPLPPLSEAAPPRSDRPRADTLPPPPPPEGAIILEPSQPLPPPPPAPSQGRSATPQSPQARSNQAPAAVQPGASQSFGSGAPSQTVQEIRTYFQDRWQPPESLDATLEYRIVLSPDGTLFQALPLNGAAARFIDRTPIPLRDTPMTNPFEGDSTVLLRLVLQANGTVQVFAE